MDFISLFQQNPSAFYFAVFIIGLAVGSFLNVVIYRLPQMMKNQWQLECAHLNQQEPPTIEAMNLAKPGSSCPSCHHKIRFYENIPVLSYILLRGQCSSCHTKISLRYPAIELLTAFMSVVVAYHFGPSPHALAGIFLTYILITLTFIDIDEQLLPDSITLPVLWLGIALSFFGIFTDLESSVLGAIFGYLSLWSVYWLFKLITGKEGMGHGDFKLLALFGAWFGWQSILMIILMSSIVGAIIGISMILILGKDKNIPIPFGPYLAIAGWLILLAGPELNQLYFNISGIS